MKKKFVCTVCGYIHEGEEAPAQCPQCKAPASKFKELVDTELTFVTEHVMALPRTLTLKSRKVCRLTLKANAQKWVCTWP